MIHTKTEKYLLIGVLLTAVAAGGYTAFSSAGELLSIFSGNMEEKKQGIEKLLESQKKRLEIKKKHEDMSKELVVAGTDSDQDRTIRQDLIGVLVKAGLTNAGDYEGVNLKNTDKKNELFKVMTYSIDKIVCTPKQLAQLLFELEKSSNVIEVLSCEIDNLFSDTGQITQRNITSKTPQFRTGLLGVNMEIARLVEYRPTEAPKKKPKKETK